MARGRQPTLEQQWEEASMEVQAIVSAELTDHDRWELEAFRAKAGLIRAAMDAINAGRPSVGGIVTRIGRKYATMVSGRGVVKALLVQDDSMRMTAVPVDEAKRRYAEYLATFGDTPERIAELVETL